MTNQNSLQKTSHKNFGIVPPWNNEICFVFSIRIRLLDNQYEYQHHHVHPNTRAVWEQIQNLFTKILNSKFKICFSLERGTECNCDEQGRGHKKCSNFWFFLLLSVGVFGAAMLWSGLFLDLVGWNMPMLCIYY